MNTEHSLNEVADVRAQLAAITDYLDWLDKDWRAKIRAGASGTMTPDIGKVKYPLDQYPVTGYITPRGDFANVRHVPLVSEASFAYTMKKGDIFAIIGTVPDAKGEPYKWYLLPEDNYVREDVVNFSVDKPQPIPPINAAIWPAPLEVYWITTHHGEHGHKGIDWGAPFGESIINPADGFVVKAFDCVKCKPEGDGAWTINNDDYGDGYGTHAILRYLDASLPLSSQAHIERYVFILYGHMSDLDVVQGFPVRANSPIGRVGSTGNSTGNHLHLEARTSDNPNINFYDATLIDPELIFGL